MAKESGSELTNKLLWIAGGAAISAVAIFYVNRALTEREELKRLQAAEAQAKVVTE
jgi:hypothetical protein